MKIAIIGASGNIGKRILKEALLRGHEVVAIQRNAIALEIQHKSVKAVSGDLAFPESILQHVVGQDILISAYGPGFENTGGLVRATENLVHLVRKSGAGRLIMVGGAGSLEVTPGQKLIHAPFFPKEWIPIAQAHIDALEVLRNSDIAWTYFSPPAFLEPGERTGKYRLGTTALVVNEVGKSTISIEDYAAALLDEAEKGQFVRQQFTAGY